MCNIYLLIHIKIMKDNIYLYFSFKLRCKKIIIILGGQRIHKHISNVIKHATISVLNIKITYQPSFTIPGGGPMPGGPIPGGPIPGGPMPGGGGPPIPGGGGP